MENNQETLIDFGPNAVEIEMPWGCMLWTGRFENIIGHEEEE